MPSLLGPEAMPELARTRLWNVVYEYTLRRVDDWNQVPNQEKWRAIFDLLCTEHYGISLQDADGEDIFAHIDRCKISIHTDPFNRVLDLIERIMRHPMCPDGFSDRMADAFAKSQLPYSVLRGATPTILPLLSDAEQKAISDGLDDMDASGWRGARSHLDKAIERFKNREWAASARESISAVESACKDLTGRKLDEAWKYLEREKSVHPALVMGFKKLYGYASDEQGVRHALVKHDEANVRHEEAAFMLTACAAFCSYLWRKTREPDATDTPEDGVFGAGEEWAAPEVGDDSDDVPF